MALTMAQTYGLARQAGFDPASAVIMAAIAMGESGLNPSSIGDVGLQDTTWGPSVGLAQIRTLKADTGTGRTRDIDRLRDPLQNLISAYQISHGGRDFSPWTVYNTGKYRQFLGQAASASSGTGTVQGVTAVQPASLTGDIGSTVRDIAVLLVVVGLGAALVVSGAVAATNTGGALKKAGGVALQAGKVAATL